MKLPLIILAAAFLTGCPGLDEAPVCAGTTYDHQRATQAFFLALDEAECYAGTML